MPVFFVAALPEGAIPTFEGGEVTDHVWIRPGDGLRAMADGRLAMWLPTSTTLQQLEHAGSIDAIAERMAPGPLGSIDVDDVSDDVCRVVMPAAGGVAGQPGNTYLIGRKRLIVVDPGDPTGPALDRVTALASERGGTIAAVVLTSVDPGHAAGAEAIADPLGVPVLVGPGGGRTLPYPVVEVADGDVLAMSDVSVQVVHTPGPRPDHLALIVAGGASVISGDLGGVRGARSIPGPADEPAWASSIGRLRMLAPDGHWLAGYPTPPSEMA